MIVDQRNDDDLVRAAGEGLDPGESTFFRNQVDRQHERLVHTGNLTSAPPYFGSVPWPPIGPDVDGLVHDLPAKRRFDALAGK